MSPEGKLLAPFMMILNLTMSVKYFGVMTCFNLSFLHYGPARTQNSVSATI